MPVNSAQIVAHKTINLWLHELKQNWRHDTTRKRKEAILRTFPRTSASFFNGQTVVRNPKTYDTGAHIKNLS